MTTHADARQWRVMWSIGNLAGTMFVTAFTQVEAADLAVAEVVKQRAMEGRPIDPSGVRINNVVPYTRDP